MVTIAFLSCLQSRTSHLKSKEKKNSHLFLHCIISIIEFFGILDIDNTKGFASSPNHNEVGKGGLEAYPLKQVVKKVD